MYTTDPHPAAWFLAQHVFEYAILWSDLASPPPRFSTTIWPRSALKFFGDEKEKIFRSR
jgi:hypothetical protein